MYLAISDLSALNVFFAKRTLEGCDATEVDCVATTRKQKGVEQRSLAATFTGVSEALRFGTEWNFL